MNILRNYKKRGAVSNFFCSHAAICYHRGGLVILILIVVSNFNVSDTFVNQAEGDSPRPLFKSLHRFTMIPLCSIFSRCAELFSMFLYVLYVFIHQIYFLVCIPFRASHYESSRAGGPRESYRKLEEPQNLSFDSSGTESYSYICLQKTSYLLPIREKLVRWILRIKPTPSICVCPHKARRPQFSSKHFLWN